jgi:rare lipoprotein A (peptidoglycan hydrolase)
MSYNLKLFKLILQAIFLLTCFNLSLAQSSQHKLQPKLHQAKIKQRRQDYMTGVASYYAKSLSGKYTASGQRLSMNKYTAAHPSLPLGSRLKVTNLRNGRYIYVVVNDRMPKSSGRVIDLTIAAAKELGFYSQGLTKVRLRLVSRRIYSACGITRSRRGGYQIKGAAV